MSSGHWYLPGSVGRPSCGPVTVVSNRTLPGYRRIRALLVEQGRVRLAFHASACGGSCSRGHDHTGCSTVVAHSQFKVVPAPLSQRLSGLKEESQALQEEVQLDQSFRRSGAHIMPGPSSRSCRASSHCTCPSSPSQAPRITQEPSKLSGGDSSSQIMTASVCVIRAFPSGR